jgi:hypothetical protein
MVRPGIVVTVSAMILKPPLGFAMIAADFRDVLAIG